MTSNPSIFEKAIAESNLYDAEIQKMALKGKNVNAIYEAISQQDVQNAADIFRPLYEKTDGKDGYVSLEVNPHLAHNTRGTIEEGRRLWITLNRPNVLIKVPATIEGLPAIRQLISEGINVNVTLLFALPRYRQVTEAYIAGDPANLLEVDVEQASWVLSELSEIGVDLKSITEKLENDGVGKFIQAFDKLMQALKKKSST